MVRGLQAVASGSNPVLTSGLDLFPVGHWPGLLKAWLALTSVKYHGNL